MCTIQYRNPKTGAYETKEAPKPRQEKKVRYDDLFAVIIVLGLIALTVAVFNVRWY